MSSSDLVYILSMMFWQSHLVLQGWKTKRDINTVLVSLCVWLEQLQTMLTASHLFSECISVLLLVLLQQAQRFFFWTSHCISLDVSIQAGINSEDLQVQLKILISLLLTILLLFVIFDTVAVMHPSKIVIRLKTSSLIHKTLTPRRFSYSNSDPIERTVSV